MKKILIPVGAAGSGKSTVAKFLGSILLERSAFGDTDAPVAFDAFAAPLKEFAGHIFGFSWQTLYGPSASRNQEFPWTMAEHDVALAKFADGDGDWSDDSWYASLGCTVPAHDAVKALHRWFLGLSRQCRETGVITARHVLQTLGTEWGRALDENIWIDAFVSRHDRRHGGQGITIAEDGRFLNEPQRTDGFPVLVVRPGLAALPGAHASEQDVHSQEMLDSCHRNGVVIINDRSVGDLGIEARLVIDTFLRMERLNMSSSFFCTSPAFDRMIGK